MGNTFNPLLGELRSHMWQGAAKKEKKIVKYEVSLWYSNSYVTRAHIPKGVAIDTLKVVTDALLEIQHDENVDNL